MALTGEQAVAVGELYMADQGRCCIETLCDVSLLKIHVVKVGKDAYAGAASGLAKFCSGLQSVHRLRLVAV